MGSPGFILFDPVFTFARVFFVGFEVDPIQPGIHQNSECHDKANLIVGGNITLAGSTGDDWTQGVLCLNCSAQKKDIIGIYAGLCRHICIR